MRWNAAPSSPRGGGSIGVDLTITQLDARRRFDSATEHAGAGLADILWRVVCSGEGMRDAERALGWPARAGKLVLIFALDRVAEPLSHPLRHAPNRGGHHSGAPGGKQGKYS